MRVELVLTLTILALTSQCASFNYLVLPSIETQCPEHFNCTTLGQLSNKVFDQQNVFLRFLNATYVMNKTLEIHSARTLKIIGYSNSTTVVCQLLSVLRVFNVQAVEIKGMNFSGCDGKQQLGIISIQNSEIVSILNCHFMNNHNTATVYIRAVNITTIAHSSFRTNTACSTCSGGAISIQSDQILVSSCTFENNVARVGGGIFVLESSQISVVDSYFKGNAGGSKGIGGAIFLARLTTFITRNSYYLNNAAIAGGAVYITQGNFSARDCIFVGNLALSGGAIFVLRTATIFAINTHFIQNSACTGGAVCSSSGAISLFSINSLFSSNKANPCRDSSGKVNKDNSLGGAIFILTGSVTSQGSQYLSNDATQGGAIFITFGTISSTGDLYANNMADFGGAISLPFGSITTQGSFFINNMANTNLGGGAFYLRDSIVNINESHFINNTAPYSGGAILIALSGSVSIIESVFLDNVAVETGGAIWIRNGSVTLSHSRFTNNKVGRGGGAVSLASGSIISDASTFEGNHAIGGYGGAIFILCGSIISSHSTFIENVARYEGGAVYIIHSVCPSNVNSSSVIVRNHFERNSAQRAAAFYLTMGAAHIAHTTMFNNLAISQTSSVYFGSASVVIRDSWFQMNSGSLQLFNTQLQLHGTVRFMNNSAPSGGAIRAAHSQIYIHPGSNITILDNTADFGGGMWLRQSTLHVNESIRVEQNKAAVSGGGIYAYQSTLEIKCESSQLRCLLQVYGNTATLNGGGIFAISSSMVLTQSFVVISSNHANYGGGVYLEQTSKIYIFKNEYEEVTTGIQESLYKVRLDIVHNTANVNGGGIYVSDNSSTGLICQVFDEQTYDSTSVSECFIQTLELYDITVNNRTNNYNTFLANNTAGFTGANIFGGLLDRCRINPSAEVLDRVHRLYLYNISSGFDYIKTTIQIEEIIDYRNFNFTNALEEIVNGIAREDVVGLISSEAVRVAFCQDNSTYTFNAANVLKKKGEQFVVSVMTVDHIGNPVNATVMSSTISTSGISRLKEGQAEQQAAGQCTQLEYNVFSEDDTAQVVLYADGPCKDTGISKQTINVFFLPCTCPVGFMPAGSAIECVCECVEQFASFDITCSQQDENILLAGSNIWIGVRNAATNRTSYTIQDCPYDYCSQKPINITLVNRSEIDRQCANSRTGVLCGQCKEGLSLVFASSRCLQCSSFYLLLIIVFGIGGIFLVGVVLALNLTMAVGTLHGLIFYANLVQANSAVFLPFSNFLTVFISWLNLDLGIEVCFYNGMNSQAKVLLQLAFPLYIYLLVIVIIVLSKHSTKMSALLSKRNPVAALCTLIFLSYSNLLRTLISALQFTCLYYSDGQLDLLWLYDANIQYFKGTHAPRFVAAIVILLAGSVYTILLFFGQWFHRYSNRGLMKWTQSTKYHTFIDVYHAPFQSKHRYWTGLLLLLLIINNLLAAVLGNQQLTLVFVGCTSFLLILLKLFFGKIYKNQINDALETLFLSNLILLSFVTVYINEPNTEQQKVSNTSLGVSFIIFVVILGYHCQRYLIRDTRLWNSLKQFVEILKRRQQRVLIKEDNCDDDDDAIADEEVYQLDTLDQPYTAMPTDTTVQHPQDITPPIIRSALHFDQLREPDLDILGPVTADDYRVPVKVHEPPIVTYTVIDAVHK